ncbi:hypothetical protein EDC04DRAFT_1691133 [Pisolithus marmoratus]|nr:hypothetical protein EDC04DRAFT_1691133 [Pisolithus marmoratus]
MPSSFLHAPKFKFESPTRGVNSAMVSTNHTYATTRGYLLKAVLTHMRPNLRCKTIYYSVWDTCHRSLSNRRKRDGQSTFQRSTPRVAAGAVILCPLVSSPTLRLLTSASPLFCDCCGGLEQYTAWLSLPSCTFLSVKCLSTRRCVTCIGFHVILSMFWSHAFPASHLVFLLANSDSLLTAKIP